MAVISGFYVFVFLVVGCFFLAEIRCLITVGSILLPDFYDTAAAA
jgi:hypothetical protein